MSYDESPESLVPFVVMAAAEETVNLAADELEAMLGDPLIYFSAVVVHH